MKVKLRQYTLEAFYEKHIYEFIDNITRWSYNPDKIHTFEISDVKPEHLDYLLELAEPHKEADYIASNFIRAVKNYRAFAADNSGGLPVKKLEVFPEAFKKFFQGKEYKWLFLQEGDGEINPYFISDCKYYKAERTRDYYTPAHCIIHLTAYKRGSKRTQSITIWKHNIGLSVGKILESMEILIETPEAVERYIEEYTKFAQLQTKLGWQMFAVGTAQTISDRWYYSTSSVAMVRDNIPTKVIVDDEDEEKNQTRNSSSESTVVSARFWKGEKVKYDYLGKDTSEDEIEEDFVELEEHPDTVVLPVHTYIRIFDLDKHDYLTIHVNNLREYPWDDSLFDKLILPKEHKTLIHMLVQNTGENVEDIVRGKMGGVIVLATGDPGTGKTLTAEVFSETIKKPLYVVQCSQLGLDTESIESNLQGILSKAARWGAILLIDEADVYIRERGNDIEQNAIVGVFLRVLEYYKGVLFMTSNRGNIVDDAIMSRATAWIQYELPDKEYLKEIWKVLGTQYKAKLDDKDILELVEKLGTISGRTVRNLLKLARLLSKNEKTDISVELIERVSNYQQLESRKKDKK